MSLPEVVVRGREIQEALETEQQTRLRRRAENALFNGAVVLGFGTLFYGGFWLYEFITNLNTQMSASLGEVIATEFPPLHPFLATKEAEDVLYRKWLIESGETEVWHPLTEQKRLRLVTLRGNIQEGGTLPMYTRDYHFLKGCERELVQSRLISLQEVVKEHPLDRISDFILRNKWYWAGVLGLTALPAGKLLSEITKNRISKVEWK